MKKKGLSLIVASMALASCGNSSIAGTYAFQLGRDGGTHFGIFLYLTDNLFKQTSNKSFSISFDLGGNNMSALGFDTDDPFAKNVLDEFTVNGNLALDGYYSRSGRKDKNGGEILTFGLDFKEIYEKLDRAYEKTYTEELPVDEESFVNLFKEGIISQLLYASYTTETVNVYIPVSIEDAYYQLYWYGYDVKIKSLPSIFTDDTTPNPLRTTRDGEGGEGGQSGEGGDPTFDDFIVIEEMPWLGKHELGSHVTDKAYIDTYEQMKKDFEDTHKEYLVKTFRDYHALGMGLIKK